jgi:hypothetical protein
MRIQNTPTLWRSLMHEPAAVLQLACQIYDGERWCLSESGLRPVKKQAICEVIAKAVLLEWDDIYATGVQQSQHWFPVAGPMEDDQMRLR